MKMYRFKPIHLHKGAPVKMYRLNLYIFTEVDNVGPLWERRALVGEKGPCGGEDEDRWQR